MRGGRIAIFAAVVLAACSGEAGTEGQVAASSPPPTVSTATASVGPSLGVLDPTAVLASQRAPGIADRVFLTRLDGGGDVDPFPQLPGVTQHPDFSRDGARLAFDQRDGDSANDQVFVAGAEGSDPTLLVPCESDDLCFQRWEPAWSPDGTRLAISTTDGTAGEPYPSVFGIAVVDVVTGAVTPVVQTRAMQDHYPRWSPDGSRLAFWGERTADDGSIETAVFVVGVDGSGLRRLTPWAIDAANPDWAPDRDLLVFSLDSIVDPPDEEAAVLVTMDPDTEVMDVLVETTDPAGQATQPRWTPDGRAIVYSHVPLAEIAPRDIWVVDADGTDDRPLLVASDVSTHPVLSPPG